MVAERLYTTLWLNDGSRRFGLAALHDNGDYDLRRYNVVIADLTGNGAPDLLTSTAYPDPVAGGWVGSLVQLATDGAGGFGTLLSYDWGDCPWGLGDLDGDGDLDVLVGDPCRTTVSVALNNGTGGLAEGTVVGHPCSSPAAQLDSVDLDGDGKLDLAIGATCLAEVRLFFGDGAAGFEATVDHPTAIPAYQVRAADWNLDGEIDLFLWYPGSVLVLY